MGFLAFVSQAETYTFRTFVGSTGGPGTFDGTGAEARFRSPNGIAIDGDGNVYLAEANHTIRKVSPARVVTTLAGMAGTPGTADGTGSAARFDSPSGVAVDADGNLFVSDAGSHTIRRITPSGAVTTFAGEPGTSGSSDGVGGLARFNYPAGLALDDDSNLWVADMLNHTLRRITPAGQVTTVAGLAGAFGSANGTGAEARFDIPWGVVIDGSGDLYVADRTSIRKVTAAGVVSSFVGLPGTAGAVDGQGTSARFDAPRGLAVDPSGYIYAADHSNHSIRKVSPTGLVTTLAGRLDSFGTTDGTGTEARFLYPAGVAVDASGNVFVSDTGNNVLRKVTAAGVVTTFAGRASEWGNLDGAGDAARFWSPKGAAVDSSGNLYVADSLNHTIRRVTPDGVVTTVAGSAGMPGSVDGTAGAARFNSPHGVAVDSSGTVYVADLWNHTIRKVTAAGVVTTLAGSQGSAGSADGSGAAARFNNPFGVAVDLSGNVYVGDHANHTVRKVSPEGVVTTLAGLAGNAATLDGTGSAARFNSPKGVAVDSSGNVYVAESKIRKVTTEGEVTTVAAFPASGIAIDSSGNLFTSSFDHTLRMIDSGGAVSTIGGVSGKSGSVDGTGAAARFASPNFLAVSASGDLFVPDANDRVRRGQPALEGSPNVDDPAGFVGAVHQLSFSGTASAFEWRVVRMPSTSAASLSSEDGSMPTFTPDVADGYEIQLDASDGSSSYIGRLALEAPRVFANQSNASEASTIAGVVFSLVEAQSSAVSLDWATEDGSAVAGHDYVAKSGSLVFDPGQTVKVVNVQLLGDSLDEDDETFFVRMTNVSGVQAGASGTITIVDDDPSPAISIDDVSFFEGDNGSTTAEFTVTLSSQSGRLVSCFATTADGTANAGSDYVALVASKITFQPGETSKTISVEIVGDDVAESDETFFVNLSGAVNATLEDSQTQGTIRNEDLYQSVAPSGLTAEATSPTSVGISWSALTGAHFYRVFRSDDASNWAQIATPAANAFVDTTVNAGQSYLYKVRAVDGSIETVDSAPELATTVLFTNATLATGVTVVKADHITELRAGVNAVRQLAGLAAASFTDPTITTSTFIKRAHVVELRAALDAARSALGLPGISYTDPTITAGVTRIKATHVQQLRDGVR